MIVKGCRIISLREMQGNYHKDINANIMQNRLGWELTIKILNKPYVS